MFVRVKKIGAHEYLYLVENAREGGRHVQRAYRAMIWLGEEIADGRTTTDAIEEDLDRRRQELFGEVSIASQDTAADRTTQLTFSLC